MRKVILGLAVSLDGFIEGPKGEYDWCFTDQDYGLSDFFKRMDAIFMGRKTYELTQEHKGQNPWKGTVTYVFSNSLKKIKDKDVRLISGDVRKQVELIKSAPGKDIWLFGGAELTTFFINESLVDEIWLSVHPILLGAGKPLFQHLKERKKLRLARHKIYNSGLVSLCYELS